MPTARAGPKALAVVGCALGAVGVAALLLRLRVDDPRLAGPALCSAAWLAWVARDFAFAPLKAARARQRERRDALAFTGPGFVDTQAGWRAP